MKSVLIDSRAPRAAKEGLARLGYNVIALPKSRHLPEGISAHPDSLIFKLGCDTVTFADYCDEAAYVFSDIREAHPDVRICFSSETPSHVYPGDAKYNALVIGNKVFARLDSISSAIKELTLARGCEIINVKQGYPACATLVLDDTHAITADKGLARTLASQGIEVTLIKEGGITLPPYDCGFIGGAAGVGDGRVYFVGDYRTHPSAAAIEAAVGAVGLAPVSLADGLLSDVGGLIFFDKAQHGYYYGDKNKS